MQNKKIHPQHILKKEKCVFFSLTMVGALKTQLKRTGVHFIERWWGWGGCSGKSKHCSGKSRCWSEIN